eukprot:363782-Chlamydomonas_euryale.AAC.3
MQTLNNCLDDLIRNALEARHEDDMEALQARDYATVRDPSLLRFLVDMRGEDTSNKQVRVCGNDNSQVTGVYVWLPGR